MHCLFNQSTRHFCPEFSLTSQCVMSWLQQVMESLWSLVQWEFSTWHMFMISSIQQFHMDLLFLHLCPLQKQDGCLCGLREALEMWPEMGRKVEMYVCVCCHTVWSRAYDNRSLNEMVGVCVWQRERKCVSRNSYSWLRGRVSRELRGAWFDPRGRVSPLDLISFHFYR